MPGPEAAPGITRVASTQNISTPACTLQHYTSHITIAIITIHTILCRRCHEQDIIKYLFYIYRDTWIQVSSLVYIYMATRVQHECLQDIFIDNCVLCIIIVFRKLEKVNCFLESIFWCEFYLTRLRVPLQFYF